MTEVQELFIEAMKVIKSLSHACGSMAQVIGTLARDARIDLLHQTQPTLNEVSSALDERDQFFTKSHELFERLIAEQNGAPKKFWIVSLSDPKSGIREAYRSNHEQSARDHYEQLANALTNEGQHVGIMLTRPDGRTEWVEAIPRKERMKQAIRDFDKLDGGPKQ